MTTPATPITQPATVVPEYLRSALVHLERTEPTYHVRRIAAAALQALNRTAQDAIPKYLRGELVHLERTAQANHVRRIAAAALRALDTLGPVPVNPCLST